MHKRIILALVTFGLALATYLLFTSRDRRIQGRTTDPLAVKAVQEFVTLPTSQSAKSLSTEGMKVLPGEHTFAQVFDDTSGRLKYQFEARTWEPISESEFSIQDLLVDIYTPRGEVTTVRADRANITLARRSGSRADPVRGTLDGNIRVTIDRTTAEWRQAHADQADPQAHADQLIHIDLEDAAFDIEQAELVSQGALIVESSEARIEDVTGLRLQWDQVDNSIDVLRFDRGGRMIMRRGGKLFDFSIPGGDRESRADDPPALAAAPSSANTPRALAVQPMTLAGPSASAAAEEIRQMGGAITANQPRSLPGVGSRESATHSTESSDRPAAQDVRSTETLAADVDRLRKEAQAATNDPIKTAKSAIGDNHNKNPAKTASGKPVKRIHTYRAVFDHEVVINQIENNKTIGQLQSDRLEINFDFGDNQRRITNTGSPDEASKPSSVPGEPAQPPAVPDAGGSPSLPEDDTALILTWAGPMELRPLDVPAAQQAGRRFDVVAAGNPVRLAGEQGKATCAQLVYRHERRQVWLSGNDQHLVDMAVTAARRLRGHEVFFDQERGLARIDGAGVMLDTGEPDPSEQAKALLAKALDRSGRGAPPKPEKPADPVEIRWTRGVDIELGKHEITRIDPATGRSVRKNKEFLRRAWFHGAVNLKRGDERLDAEEAAVTFAAPVGSSEEVTPPIEFLNLAGDVKMLRDDDSIQAQTLDVELAPTPNGQSSARIVDASGDVLVRQRQSEFRAQKMHVTLSDRPDTGARSENGDPSLLGNGRVGIETLFAEGDVYIFDPEQNLKIRNAVRLEASFGDDKQIKKADIFSRAPDVFARARLGDMAVHGHHIRIDMLQEAIDVEGPGRAYMLSRRDFGGRSHKEPEVVKINWRDRMQFRLAENYGLFIGAVQSISKTFTMDCDKLTVRFANIPPVEEQKKEDLIDRLWRLGPVTGDQAEIKPADEASVAMKRKKPVYVVAEGQARALSSEHAPAGADGRPGRLESRALVVGDRIEADLEREQMSVPGPGKLQIEDYQFDPKSLNATPGGGPLMSSVRTEGPSQTLVEWQNSMDFFVDRNLVAFDRGVQMIHRSGLELASLDELAVAMNIPREALQKMGQGRKASLTCGNLLLEFMSKPTAREDDAGPFSFGRATDLRRLIAKNAVHLQDGTKSLMGEHLQFLQDTNEVRLEGSPSFEARIIDQEENDQRLSMWRGPLLIWNRLTNQIEAPKASIRTSGR